MEEGACRSPSLHPQIQPSEDSAAVTSRRSPCLHPQIQASDEAAGVTRRRTSPVPLESLPFNDDMLREILIRLPPRPSSLPRASAVCKRWRRLVTDTKFQRLFRAHHRKPPLLGVFQCSIQGIVFTPVLDPPDRIPPARFSLGRWSSRQDFDLLDCRHGLVLIRVRDEVVVCDPITGEQRGVAVPSELESGYSGAVLCAAGHHGACHLSSYKVVLLSIYTKDKRLAASVYSSETGIWSTLISMEAPRLPHGKSAVLVGNCLYWLCIDDGILEFDLGKQRLTVSRVPLVTNDMFLTHSQIVQAGGHGVVGYGILSYPHFQMWQRKNLNGHGVATWVPWKTIDMNSILKLPPQTEEVVAFLLGYGDDSDVIFLSVRRNIYMVQLKSMQSRKLYETIDPYHYYPFRSFYTPGTTIALDLMELKCCT